MLWSSKKAREEGNADGRAGSRGTGGRGAAARTAVREVNALGASDGGHHCSPKAESV